MNTTAKVGVVYYFESINGLIYVGSTTRRPYQRKSEHLHYLRHGTHFSKLFQEEYNLVGEDGFTFHVIEKDVDANFLLSREQFHLWRNIGSLLNSSENAHSLDSAMSGVTGRVQSTEERLMRSKSQLKAIAEGRAGSRLTWKEERRLSHGKALTGRKMPAVKPETKRKISEALKGRKCPDDAIKASVAKRTAFIKDELPIWLKMLSDGKSYREIEKITGRTRKMVRRECEKAINNGFEQRTSKAVKQ